MFQGEIWLHTSSHQIPEVKLGYETGEEAYLVPYLNCSTWLYLSFFI